MREMLRMPGQHKMAAHEGFNCAIAFVRSLCLNPGVSVCISTCSNRETLFPGLLITLGIWMF